jgi:cytochrome P450
MSGLFDPSQPVIGQGLSTNRGESWLRQRRMVQPAFHHRQVAAFTGEMAQKTAALLESWRGRARGNQIINVTDDLLALNHRILLQLLFDVKDDREAATILAALAVTRDDMARRLRAIISMPRSLPTPANRRFQQAVATLDAFTYGLLARRRQESEATDDVLGMLLSARDRESGAGMSDKQLHDELMTLFFAAYEDPANALSWLFYLLAHNPAVEQKLRQEIAGGLDGRTPTYQDIEGLSYTKMVVDEGLRLYPPTWSMLRDVTEEDELGGYLIPKGSMVLLNAYLTHRLPAFWPQPEQFDPERFRPDQTGRRPRYAYYPFGGGPRQCIGNGLALMQIRLILVMIVQHFCFQLAPGYRLKMDALSSLRPGGGVLLNLQEASGAKR